MNKLIQNDLGSNVLELYRGKKEFKASQLDTNISGVTVGDCGLHVTFCMASCKF